MEMTPCLWLGGRCHDAFETYAKVLGGDVVFEMPFADAPDRVQFARLEAGGLVLHGMDAHPSDLEVQGMAIMLALDSAAEAERVFGELMADGTITAPMGPSPFAERFGMGTDGFGVPWMISG